MYSISVQTTINGLTILETSESCRSCENNLGLKNHIIETVQLALHDVETRILICMKIIVIWQAAEHECVISVSTIKFFVLDTRHLPKSLNLQVLRHINGGEHSRNRNFFDVHPSEDFRIIAN